MGSIRGLGVWLLGGRILDRLMLVMNDKQNRWARQEIYDQLIRSWLVDSVRSESPNSSAGMTEYLREEPGRPRRILLFVRVAQDWNSFLLSIPRWRLAELGDRSGTRKDVLRTFDAPHIGEVLDRAGCDLSAARTHYERVGGDQGARTMNQVATGFTALSEDIIDRLAEHAAWQVHAAHAVYA
jgi:hypothetical protein